MFLFSNLAGYCFAQTAAPDIPGVDGIVEKGGSWALVGLLMWWVLGRLSRQLDGLTNAVEKLASIVGEKS